MKDNEDDYVTFPANENLVSLMKPLVMIPDQIASVLNNIGQVKVGDKLYISKIGRTHHTERNNRFIPQSEQITYSNLRATVTALADANTPAEFRRRF